MLLLAVPIVVARVANGDDEVALDGGALVMLFRAVFFVGRFALVLLWPVMVFGFAATGDDTEVFSGVVLMLTFGTVFFVRRFPPLLI